MEKCNCSLSDFSQYSSKIEAFIHVRDQCRALKEILIPDSIWPEYRQAVSKPIGDAKHQPILYLAFTGGALSKLTNPIHKYILDWIDHGKTLKNQYQEDLIENWFDENNQLKRNKNSKRFRGFLAEIRLAEFLKRKNITIKDLDAFGARHDIILTGTDYNASVEVKYIGEEDTDFLRIVRAMKEGGTAADNLNPYNPRNFLILRVFDAASQLQKSKEKRLAYLIISPYSWTRFKFPLISEMIDWQSPEFYGGDNKWMAFFDEMKKKKKYVNIDQELKPIINSLHELHILRDSADYNLHEEYTYNF